MKKKIFFLLLMVAFVICVIFLGISSIPKTKTNIRESDNYNMFHKTKVFSSLDYIDSDQKSYNSSLKPLCNLIDDGLFLMQQSSDDIDNYYRMFVLDEMSLTHYDLSTDWLSNKICLGGSTNENLFLFVFCPDEQKEILITYDIKTKETISKKEFTDLIWPINDIRFDKHYIYISTEEKGSELLMILDYNLNTVMQAKTEKGWKIFPNSNQCLILKDNKDFLIYTGKDGLVKKKYDLILPKGISMEDNIRVFPGNNIYEFYFIVSNSTEINDEYSGILFGSNSGETVKIMSFEQMGMDSQKIISVLSDEEGNFLIGQLDDYSMAYDYYFFQKTEEQMDFSINANKEKLIIGGMIESPSLSKAISAYNSSNEKYYIEYINFNTYDDYYDGLKQFNINITADNRLDAVLLSGLDRNNLIQKGVLSDLSEYFAESKTVSQTMFVQPVINNMKTDNGEIYTLYPEMRFEAIVSDKEIDIFKYETENIDELCPIVFDTADPLPQFMQLIRYSGNRFVDENSGSVCLDEDFIFLMELVKKEAEINKKLGNDNGTLMLKEKRAVSKYCSIDFPYSYFYIEFLLDEKPHCNNIASSGPILIPESEIGLLENSDKKEIMYDFLDFIFEDANYHKFFGNMYFPVTKSAWNDWETRLTATKDYEDRFGETIIATEFYYSDNGVQAMLGPISKDEVAQMNSFYENATYIQPMPAKYLNIIEEEVMYYFNDTRTAEEVCENIENRITIAINE